MSETRDIGSVLRSVFRRIDPEGRRDRPRVVDAWRHAAGPEIVRHSLGYDIRSGELVVFVDSQAWATELAAMSEHLRVRLNEGLGEEMVRSIRFAVSKHVAERVRARERREAGERSAEPVRRLALSPEEVAALERATGAVSSDDLREAVFRAMVRDAERRKWRAAEESGERPAEP